MEEKQGIFRSFFNNLKKTFERFITSKSEENLECDSENLMDACAVQEVSKEDREELLATLKRINNEEFMGTVKPNKKAITQTANKARKVEGITMETSNHRKNEGFGRSE